MILQLISTKWDDGDLTKKAICKFYREILCLNSEFGTFIDSNILYNNIKLDNMWCKNQKYKWQVN